MSTGIVWFRRDLRLIDNPAWSTATGAHDRVVALFVLDPLLFNRVSSRRQAMLIGNLRALDDDLRAVGGRLRIERGDPGAALPRAFDEVEAETVHANRDVTPYAVRRDAAVASELASRVRGYDGNYVVRPGTVLAASGRPYQVFTPFHRKWLEMMPPSVPAAAPVAIDDHPGDPLPETGPATITPGTAASLRRLEAYVDNVDRYPDTRDRPDLDLTSRLSIDLKWGTLGPRTVVDAIGAESEGRRAFIRQLAWRDFHAQTMVMHPGMADRPIRADYEGIEWRTDPDGFGAWTRGETGYPLVDAGMRQLAAEGWMHNRVRMIAASFLVKDLLIDWRLGERWFRRYLLDADVAQNAGNWQWVAGTGTDAAPYFRIFNPTAQSQKFDPDGAYIRRYVPELARLTAPSVHAPWTVAPLDLATAGVVLGDTYPAPIVDHAMARERALDTYARGRA